MKVTVIGRGTVGCSSVAFYLKNTDWEIDWVYDPNINPMPVGEGTTLIFPNEIKDTLNFSYDDLRNMNGTIKNGIYKEGWAKQQKPFFHNFSMGNIGIHFTAATFQQYYFDKLCQNKRITAKEENYKTESEIDSDFILDCSGNPVSLEENYVIPKHISVNSAYVTQCYWDFPKFDYTLTIARPYGWVFGIPLRNRCAVGYLYNSDINDVEHIKQDVQNVFEEFGLVASNETRNINFKTYYRKQNFCNRIAYNGNKSFFLEPLEATSTGVSSNIVRLSYLNWTGKVTQDSCNVAYSDALNDIESMICLHYMSGSKYKTVFWEHAQSISKQKIKKEIDKNQLFSHVVQRALNSELDFSSNISPDVGTWNLNSYIMNINGLGIKEDLKELFSV